MKPQTVRALTLVVALAALLLCGSGVLGQQEKPAKEQRQVAQPPSGNKATAKDPNETRKFPDFVAGLKTTPGCLGVETAQTSSGKNVIFAWFENKRAVLKWYYSDMHQEAMKTFFPTIEHRKALSQVAEDSGPLMVIASVTFAKKPQFAETTLPISQIAIELYQPVPGGAFLGSRFAPAAVKVPSLRDYNPKDK
jgi:hypothetical protein